LKGSRKQREKKRQARRSCSAPFVAEFFFELKGGRVSVLWVFGITTNIDTDTDTDYSKPLTIAY
jgi:hypothetical protein